MNQTVFDLHEAQQAVTDALATVDQNLAAASRHLERIEAVMQALEEAGMYPALPTREAWERRTGSFPVYFYLYWRQRGEGGYAGPDGKRKVYVGCDPQKIAEARRKVENRRRWERLNSIRHRLRQWLSSFEYDTRSFVRQGTSLASRSAGYVQSDLAEFAPADLPPLLQTAEQDLVGQQVI